MEKKIKEILKSTKISSFESPTHKRRLKVFLLERYQMEKSRYKKTLLLRKWVFTLSSMVVIFFLSFYLLLPQYNIALAKKIAQKDPEIKEAVERGNLFTDIRTTDHKAFLLISPQKVSFNFSPILSKEEKSYQSFGGERMIIVEVDLKRKIILSKREVGLREIIPPQKMEEAEDIFKREINHLPSSQERLLKIEIPYSKIKLGGKGNIRPVLSSPKVEAIYQVREKKWKGEIDFQKKRVIHIQMIESQK